MARTKVDAMWEDLKNKGYFQSDKATFDKYFYAPGEQGYKNRKALYDDLHNKGYLQSPTYEDFAQRIGLHATGNAGRAGAHGTKLSQLPADVVERRVRTAKPPTPLNKSKARQRLMQQQQAIEEQQQRWQQQSDRQQRYVQQRTSSLPGGMERIEERAKEHLATGKAAPVPVAPNPEVVRGDMVMGDDGRMQQAYQVGSDLYSSRAGAEADLYRQAHPLEDELQQAYLERERLQEEMNRAGSSAYSANVGSGSAFMPQSAQGAAMYNSPEFSMLSTAYHQNEQRIKTLERERDADGFWRTVGKELFSLDTWDFGASEFMDASALMRYGQGDNLTPEQEDARESMLLNTFMRQGADQQYGQNDTFKQRAATITAQAIPFVAQFLATGGMEGITAAGGKLGGKMAAKWATGRVGEWILKNTGVLAGDMAAGFAMANTVGALTTGADIMNRHQGQVVMGPDGTYRFEGGKSWGRSIYEGEVANTLEYYTEMLGAHIDGVGGMLGAWLSKTKAGQRLGTSELSRLFSRIKGSEFYNATSHMLRSGGFNGYPGEVLEEEANLVLNALLVGDNKWSDLVDKDTQLDIVGGMLLSVGFMQTPGIVGGSYQAAQYYRYKHATDVADQTARARLGDEKWDALKSGLDEATNKEVVEILGTVLADESLPNFSKRAVADYVTNLLKMRGYNLRTMADAKDKVDNPEQADDQQADTNEAFHEGYNAPDEEQENIGNRMNEASQRLTAMGYSDEDLGRLDRGEYDTAFLNSLPDDQRIAVLDYLNAKAALDGTIQHSQDEIENAVARSDAQVDRQTHKDTGMLHRATLKPQGENKTGQEVYVIGGQLVMTGDGTMIDTEASDDSLFAYNPATGEIEQYSANDFESVDDPVNPEQLKAESADNIRQTMAQQIAARINGDVQAGGTYDMMDDQGNAMRGTVLEVTDDGTAMVQMEGTQQPIALPLQHVQTWVDNAKQARMSAGPVGQQAQQEPAQSAGPRDNAAPVVPAAPAQAPAQSEAAEERAAGPVIMPAPGQGDPQEMLDYFRASGASDRAIDKTITNNIVAAAERLEKAQRDAEENKETDLQKQIELDNAVEAAQRELDYWNEVGRRRWGHEPGETAAQQQPTEQAGAPVAENEMQPVEEPTAEIGGTAQEPTQDAAAADNTVEREPGMSAEDRAYWDQRDPKAAEVVDRVAREMGLPVVTVDLDPYINGCIHNGVIYINANSPELLGFVMGHEMTHDMQRRDAIDGEDGDAYTTFKKLAIQYARENYRPRVVSDGADVERVLRTFDEYVEWKKERYRDGVGQELTDAQVLDEIAADVAGRILQDPEKAMALLEREAADVAEGNGDLSRFQRLKEAILEWIRRLKMRFAPEGEQPDEEQYTRLEEVEKALQNLYETTVKNTPVLKGDGRTVTDMTDVAAADVEREGTQYSYGTENMVSEKLRRWATSGDGAKLGWTPEKIDSVIQETDVLIDAIDKALQGDKNYDEWRLRQPTMRIDWRYGEERPVVTWTRGNIEYKYDMSADLLCVNNEGMEEVLSSPAMTELLLKTMLETKITDKDMGVFSREDYGRLYEVMRDQGFTVPCPGCFDYAARLKMLPSVAQNFAKEVNAVIDERNKDRRSFDKALKEEAKKAGNALGNGLPATAKSRSEAIRIAVAGDNITKHINWHDLLTADGQTGMLAEYGGLFRAWQRTGAGRPKDKLLPEPWIGEIVDTGIGTIIAPYGDKTPSFREKEVNVGTGLRRNSHSEFRVTLIIDEIQMLREAFVKNLTVFKYMKELDDVRLFGRLGVKYNMSFFPGFDENGTAAGLDANGDYIAAEESVGAREFPYQGEDGRTHYDGMKGREEAMKYCNENVSLSSIAFSVPHFIKLLTDVPTPSDRRGWVGSIIPFHSSGATTKDLAVQGLGLARANSADAEKGHAFADEAYSDWDKGVTNFEQVQNDRFGEGWIILEGKKKGQDVPYGHKMEFASGTHYYNQRLGIHLFPKGYVYDSELPDGRITKQVKDNPTHPFVVDYNDKVREIGSDYGYKEAADYYVQALREIGMIPRFDFEVPEQVFLAACAAAHVDPHHPKLGWKGEGNSWSPTDAESYYSVWCDYGMTDPKTGKWSPHRPVGYINAKGEREFRLPDNTIEIAKEGLNRYSRRRAQESGMVEDAIREYVRRSVEAGRMDGKKARRVLKKYGMGEERDAAAQYPDGIDGGARYSLSDEAYAKAVEKKNDAAAQKLVDDAAKAAGMATDENGKLIDLYHGTDRFGFTIFDRLKSRMGAFFTSTRRNVAANYAGDDNYAGVRKINKGYKQDDSQEGILDNARSVFDQDWKMATDEQKQAIVTKVEADARKVTDEIEKRQADVETLPTDEELDIANATAWVMDLFYTVAYAKENGNDGADLYRLVSDGVERYNENKQVIRDYVSKHYDELDEKQKNYLNYLTGWDSGDVAIDIECSYKRIVSGKELATVTGDSMLTLDELKENTDEAHNIGAYHLYGNLGDNPLIVDAGGKNWYSLEYEGRKFDTDTLAKYAKENGYTALVVKNVYDYGDKADDYIFFEPSQLKSADPATYDDNGKLIPLSKRFNAESKDIRFSVGEETESEKAGRWVNRGDMERRRDEILEELASRGFVNVSSTKSEANGLSYYITVFNNAFDRELAKIRISNHSVANAYRLTHEYHVKPSDSAAKVAEDIFGGNDAARFSISERTNEVGNEVYTETREDGTKDREVVTMPDGSREVTWFDEAGRKKEKLDYFPNGEVRQVSNYDSDGELTRQIQYDENRRAIRHWEPRIGTDWERDENGVARGMSNGVEMVRYSVGEESQKIFDTAKRKFGETKDIREAGYVLPDGVMLDFSGRHELDPGSDSSFLAGSRTTDHRAINEISFVYDENGDEVDTGVSSDMPDFIRRGAIRIDNNAGLINLSTKPTAGQRKVLRQLVAENGGTVDVDFGDGWDTDHHVEYNEAKATRVLGDIDRYFDEGIKPEGNARYSLSLGAPYQGSKGQIATRVVDALPSGRRFVDLFAGGGAVTHAAMLSGKYGEYRVNDINPAGLELFLKGINGDYRDYQPRELSAEEFKAIKGTPEGLMLSYGGLGRNVDPDKDSVARRVRRVQRLEDLKPYADQVESSNIDYRDVELEPGDVVYADIPYHGTNKTGYREGSRFDKQAFSDWALGQDVPIYVSEQSMPEGWVEVASWEMPSMNAQKKRGEKLFVQAKFAGDAGIASAHGTPRFSISPEEQEAQIHSANFKNWFGDWENDPEHASKVVDEEGRPLVVYRGGEKINIFEPDKASRMAMYGPAFYATPSYADAQGFGKERTGNADNVQSVYLDVRNPWVDGPCESLGYPKEATMEQARELVDLLTSKGLVNGGIILARWNDGRVRSLLGALADAKYEGVERGRGEFWHAGNIVQDALKELGYDGVIGRFDSGDGMVDQVAAFDPTQIKSATENNGEFSRENPDIRYSISAEEDREYLDAVESGDMDKAARMVMEAAKRAMPDTEVVDENGGPKVVYHQTNAKRWINRETGEDWEKLDWRKKMEWENKSQEEWEDAWEEQDFYTFDDRYARQSIEMPAIFFSPENDPHHEYGERTIAAYLDIKNPAINPDIPNRGVTDTAGRDAMEALKAQGYDGFIRTDEDGNIREYGVFDSNQVKSAEAVTRDDDGNVIPLSQRFDEGKKDIRFSLSGDGTVEEYNKAVNMTGRTFNVGGREVKPGITRYNFQEAFQDSILSVKKLQQVVERHFGIKLPTRENAWMYENRLSSINMHERKSFIDKVYEPMMKIADAIMKRGVKEKELNAYLICKHGLERNQVFAARDAQEEADEIARNGGTPDMQQLLDKYRQRDYSGLTGVTGIEGDITDIEAEAQRIVDEFEQRHGQLCNELWDAIRKATQWSLRKSYQSGMMSAATFDHVRNMFQYYIPLRGWSETTAEDVYSYMMGEHGAFNGVLKKAEGRTSVADDPLATIGNMAESALIQGNRNLLKQHLLRMAQNHPTDVCQVRDVWLVEGPGGVWEPHWPNIPEDATPDEIDQILQDHEADMQQLEAGGSAKRVRNNLDIPYRIDPKHVPEHAVVAKVAGVDHVVYINGNPRAAQAINGMTGAPREIKNGFLKFLVDHVFGDVKRFYSSVLTSLNINFSGANFVRDLPHAYAMTFIKQGPLKAAEYIAKSFQVIPWVFKNQFGKTGTSQMDRYFQEFLSSGSVTGYAHINDVDAWKANNKRRFARLSALGKAKVAVPRALGEVINAIGWFSETLELIPRFTAFLVERQAGKDIATATKAAKDITTNFNKKGSEVTPGVWGAVAGALRYMKMFFNPIVQGMYQFVDVASMGKENKWVGPRMVLATMHLPVLGAIVPYLNQFLLEALGGDDDDDYWLLNEYTRRNNVCIFTGNGYLKIPIAPVFRELYGMGEVVATRHAGKADNEKTTVDLIDQLRTMGSVEGQSSYNEWSLARFLLPEHFAPLIDVMNNENFTGGPIYYDNNYKEYAPEYTKAKKSTWSPLVAASKWLNEMMGGDEDIAADNSGKWLNPAVWQHLITNVAGGFAQLAGDVVAGVTDITEGKEIDPSNIPVIKRFYSGSSDERANWARFGIYKDYEKEYTKAKEKYQALDKRDLPPVERAAEVAKFAETHPKAAAIYAVWEGGIKGADIPQQMSKLGKDDPKYWDLVKEAVAKAEKAMNSGYVRAWEQKRKDRPDSMSDKELNDRFDKSDNDSIRHIMADEIAKRAGSQDFRGREPQDDWSDKSVAAWEAYQDQRTSDDIKADAELSNLLKVDEDEKDKERIKMLGYIKDELNKIRRGKGTTSRSAGVKGLGEGDDERVMNELRAARKQVIEDLKNGSAEQAYRNLEKRTIRLGLRQKPKK